MYSPPFSYRGVPPRCIPHFLPLPPSPTFLSSAVIYNYHSIAEKREKKHWEGEGESDGVCTDVQINVALSRGRTSAIDVSGDIIRVVVRACCDSELQLSHQLQCSADKYATTVTQDCFP